MATFNNGALGGFSGKLGTVVGSTWRGQNVMRSLPELGTQKFSPAQLRQQQRFKVVQEFLSDLKFLLSDTFGSNRGKNPPYNNAMSYHIVNHAFLSRYQYIHVLRIYNETPKSDLDTLFEKVRFGKTK